VIPPAVVERYREKIERMADDIKVIMQQEKEERLVCDVMPTGGKAVHMYMAPQCLCWACAGEAKHQCPVDAFRRVDFILSRSC
jgi:hypothetical protein